MIPAPVALAAYYRRSAGSGATFLDWEDVIAFNDVGEALVVEGDQLVLARHRPGMLTSLDRLAGHWRPIAALPGDGWFAEYASEDEGTWRERIVVWLIGFDGSVEALTVAEIMGGGVASEGPFVKYVHESELS